MKYPDCIFTVSPGTGWHYAMYIHVFPRWDESMNTMEYHENPAKIYKFLLTLWL
jgi:hypothetical protein